MLFGVERQVEGVVPRCPRNSHYGSSEVMTSGKYVVLFLRDLVLWEFIYSWKWKYCVDEFDREKRGFVRYYLNLLVNPTFDTLTQLWTRSAVESKRDARGNTSGGDSMRATVRVRGSRSIWGCWACNSAATTGIARSIRVKVYFIGWNPWRVKLS